MPNVPVTGSCHGYETPQLRRRLTDRAVAVDIDCFVCLRAVFGLNAGWTALN